MPPANDPVDDNTRQSSCSSFRILSRSSSSGSSVAGVSSHGSDGPTLVPQGTSGVLGAGILATAIGSGGGGSNATEKLKTTDFAASMLVSKVLGTCSLLSLFKI